MTQPAECACGCGAEVTQRSIGRPRRYVSGAHRQSALRDRRKSIAVIETEHVDKIGVAPMSHRPMTFETVTLDAIHAQQLLAASTGNRRLSAPAVRKMVDDMLGGRWHLTAEALQIDTNGRLINGHHRLSALVNAAQEQPDICCPFLVARDVPVDSFDVIDQGQPRSAAQVLILNQVAGASTRMAAAVKHVLRFDRFPDNVWTSTTDVSKAAVIEYATKHADQLAALSPAPRRNQGALVNGSAYLAVSHLVFRDSAYSEMWESFDEGVRYGAHLALDDPRMATRNWTTTAPWGNGQMYVGGYLWAWNAFVQDRPIKLLRYRRDMLPMPGVA